MGSSSGPYQRLLWKPFLEQKSTERQRDPESTGLVRNGAKKIRRLKRGWPMRYHLEPLQFCG